MKARPSISSWPANACQSVAVLSSMIHLKVAQSGKYEQPGRVLAIAALSMCGRCGKL
jgi:hypothetical protein